MDAIASKRDKYPMSDSDTHLHIRHNITFQGNREKVREAINWCFSNCSGEWVMDRICDCYPDKGEDGWASVQFEFSDDRDAVLFKTFWNDR